MTFRIGKIKPGGLTGNETIIVRERGTSYEATVSEIANTIVYKPEIQSDISLGSPNILDLNCNNAEQAMFEPQKETDIAQAIDIDFSLSFSNTDNASLISMVLQLTGTITITMPSDVLCSNSSSIGTWDTGTKELEIVAGTADIIEFQFLRYSTTSEWILKVSEVAV